MRSYTKQFIKDIIPVIVGILIALFINNWNEDRKDKKYINQFYSSLKQELAETKKEIIDKTPHQQALVDSLDAYSMDDSVSLIKIIEKAQGINGPFIRVSYWKALSNSKIELLEYDRLSTLVNIEEGKELLKLKLQNLLDFVYSNMTKTGKEEKVTMRIMMTDIMNTQKRIQKEIDKILNE